jgi:hypothetical protein
MCKVTADLARLNGVVARLTNVSIEERRDALGPEWADFMRAPFKARPRPRLPLAAPGRRAARGFGAGAGGERKERED